MASKSKRLCLCLFINNFETARSIVFAFLIVAIVDNRLLACFDARPNYRQESRQSVESSLYMFVATQPQQCIDTASKK